MNNDLPIYNDSDTFYTEIVDKLEKTTETQLDNYITANGITSRRFFIVLAKHKSLSDAFLKKHFDRFCFVNILENQTISESFIDWLVETKQKTALQLILKYSKTQDIGVSEFYTGMIEDLIAMNIV